MLVLPALRSNLRCAPLSYLGRCSYSLYLLHQNIGVSVIGLIKAHTALPDWVAIGITVAGALALSAAMFELVEKPAQRLVLDAWERWMVRNNDPAGSNPAAAGIG
jgi:peptidoglycan/LPS O-acetylase OafA/YrhL